jgi:hypothetical protein
MGGRIGLGQNLGFFFWSTKEDSRCSNTLLVGEMLFFLEVAFVYQMYNDITLRRLELELELER